MFCKRFIPTVVLIAISCVSMIDHATAQTLYGSAGTLQGRENSHNADWSYSWSPTPSKNPFDVNVANFEYVPMIWRAQNNSNSNPYFVYNQINSVKALENNFGVHVDYVLGFNEPELSDQANMTVDQAIDMWDIITNEFENTDVKLVSPAVSGNGQITAGTNGREDGWLYRFMEEVESRNDDNNANNDLQVDVIAYHFYTVGFNGRIEANKLIAQIDDLWTRYQRPIWITEFAGTSFSANNPIHSTEERQAFNQAFLAELIPQFDARPYVERVAWWQFGGVGVGPRYTALSTVVDGAVTPTVIGEEYFRTTLPAGQTYNFATGDLRSTYVHYLKGSNLTNTGPDLIEALRALDVMESSTIMSGTGDFGFEIADDTFIRVRSGATLRKQGGNTVTAPGTPIFNHGTVLVEGGTLQLQDGTELTGDGTLRVESNGTLAISGGIGGEDVSLSGPSITLNGGLLHVKDGSTTTSSELIVSATSEVRTDGNLIVSGGTTGAGRIVATGSGALFLTGEGLHANGATVSDGSLIVANGDASATGAGSVLALGTGTFGGFGLVDGNVQVAAGGTVAPAISQGSTDSIPAIDEGVVVNDAIDFDFNGIQDDAPLTQTSSLNQALRLVSGLDFGPGVRPRNAGNEGDEFNVAGFRTDNNAGAGSNRGDYLTFTIAPVAGLAMFIEDVTFKFHRDSEDSATQYTVMSSLDGFSFPARWGNVSLASTDLSDHELISTNPGTGVTADEVEFRIVGVGAESDSDNTHFIAASVDVSFVSDPNSIAFDPTGILQVGGNYTQLDFATLKIDLGGSAAGEFDQLQVAGNASLNGTLDISMLDGFTATAGQTFDIITANAITGTFDNVIAPEGMDVQVTYSSNAVSLQVTAGLAGDFDADGDVDVDDIDFYAGNINSPATGDLAQLDLNGDGQINRQDLVFHIENFVQTSNGQTGALLGDLNLDGSVDILSDAFTMIGNLNQAAISYADGDMDMNGTVNVLGDAFVLIGNFGPK